MKYIIQTLPYEVFNEAQKINSLFEQGLDVLHIRKPNYSDLDMINIIDGIREEYHNKIVLHNNFSLLKKYDFKGVHATQEELNGFFYNQYFKYLKYRFNVEVSVTVSKLKKSEIENNLVDYVVLGPIFKKYSEETIKQNFNLFELKNDLDKFDKKIYASGCFSLKNIFAIQNSGFNGSVLQSYIWKSDDILNAFNTLKLNVNKDEVLNTVAV